MFPPIPGSEKLLSEVRAALRLATAPMVIGIDGAIDSGALSTALWLGWQLCIPVVFADLFIVKGTRPIQWRCDELRRVIKIRSEFRRSSDC